MDKKLLLHFYKQHVQEMLLPFWSRALDRHHGGVYTCFNNTGDSLLSKDKYTWSQGRFLWLWSRIARMISEHKLEGDAGPYYDHLRKTLRFLEENVFMENGHCAFLLTESGEKKESIPGKGFDTSVYADCFVVIGMSEYAHLMRDSIIFERALAVYYRISQRIRSGTFRSEPYPVPEGYRSHAISMIMLGVTQGLADVAEVLNHDKRSELYEHSIFYMNDIMDNFCLEDHRIVEMLPADPAKEGSLLYRHVNPGHTIECMWFVMHTAQKSGRRDHINKAVQAIERAVDVGWDTENGGLLRFVDLDGGMPQGEKGFSPCEKLVSDSWETKLWWPHSEALYASLLALELTGNSRMQSLYQRIEKYTFETFPNPNKEVGEWIQIRDRKGRPLDAVVALPVKDPFHILRNMLLIIDLLEKEGRRVHS